MKRLPELGTDAIVRISRQGGFAAVTALSRPREIDFAQCNPDQRDQVCSVLQTCLPVTTEGNAGAADRRFYRIELQFGQQNIQRDLVLQVPEEGAPDDLVLLWKEGT